MPRALAGSKLDAQALLFSCIYGRRRWPDFGRCHTLYAMASAVDFGFWDSVAMLNPFLTMKRRILQSSTRPSIASAASQPTRQSDFRMLPAKVSSLSTSKAITASTQELDEPHRTQRNMHRNSNDCQNLFANSCTLQQDRGYGKKNRRPKLK